MNILIAHDSPSIGGLTTYTYAVGQKLAQRGHRVLLLEIVDAKTAQTQEQKGNLLILRRSRYFNLPLLGYFKIPIFSFSLAAYLLFKETIQRHSPNVLLIFSPLSLWGILLAKTAQKYPLTIFTAYPIYYEYKSQFAMEGTRVLRSIIFKLL